MKMSRLLVPLLIAAAACEDSATTVVLGTGSRLRVLHAAGSFTVANVYVDGVLIDDIGLGANTGVDVGPGLHTVRVDAGEDMEFSRQYQFQQNRAVTIVLVDSSGLIRPSVLSDTGAVVPAGKTKLRVAHYAAGAPPVSIWRTQPDYQTPIRVMFPFRYADESPYLQSDPGDWRVMASSEVPETGNPPMPDTLANSGAIGIPAGQSRTVVLITGPGGALQLVVLEP